MIPFCLTPGEYQPSGYLNVSRARNISWLSSSSVIGKPEDSLTPVDLHVYASAINFLIIGDGSLSLRYTT